MWDFKSSLAWGLLKQTAEFTAYRVGVFLGIALCYTLLAFIGFSIGNTIVAAVTQSNTNISTVFALRLIVPPLFILLFCSLMGLGLWFRRKHVLWYIRAPHMALMVEILEGRRLPRGNQVKAGRSLVKQHYGDMNTLWSIRHQIKRTLPAINVLLPLHEILGMRPGKKGIGVNAPAVYLAERPFDELVFSHGLRQRIPNPFIATREGLVLLAQNGKPVLGNALTLQGLGWAYAILAFLSWLAVFSVVLMVWPTVWLPIILASGFFAWGTKAGLVDAQINSCLMQIYVGATRKQRPNPGWEKRLEADSKSFVALGARAAAGTDDAKQARIAPQKNVIGSAFAAADMIAPETDSQHISAAAALSVPNTSAGFAPPFEPAPMPSAPSAFAPPPELAPTPVFPASSPAVAAAPRQFSAVPLPPVHSGLPQGQETQTAKATVESVIERPTRDMEVTLAPRPPEPLAEPTPEQAEKPSDPEPPEPIETASETPDFPSQQAQAPARTKTVIGPLPVIDEDAS